MIFTRFASSLVAPSRPIVRTAVGAAFDYEGELAVVIGRHVHRANREQGPRRHRWLCLLLDGTLRDSSATPLSSRRARPQIGPVRGGPGS